MLDHFTLTVANLEASRRFFEAALAPLGYRLNATFESYLGFSDHTDGGSDFWLTQGPVKPTHVAFRATSRAAVRAFYDAAIAAGAKDHGKPGIRAEYHPQYYGAFVIDPDGNNVEAVCKKPE